MASYTKINEATISYYDGNVYLKTDINPAVVEINYKGTISAESQLPNGFLILGGNNKIIITRINKNTMPELLFSYIGKFEITTARAYSVDGSNMVASIDKLQHTYRATKDTWSQLNSTWLDYRETGKSFSSGIQSYFGKTKIINNGLHTRDMGRLYLPNGDKYEGYFNFDGRKIFTTGETMDANSIRLRMRKKKFKRKKLSAKQIGRRNNG